MKTFVRRHLAVTLLLVLVTAYGSYGYFHIDEYFQVIELTRFKLGHVEAWALPWEHASRMRPWLQPGLYYLVARAAGESDPFVLAFLFRLVTGLLCVGALAAFLRTSLPWLLTEEERRVHVRVATLAGFFPFLFVRTSSETLSMALFTWGFALVLRGTRAPEFRVVPASGRFLDAGVLFGLAFEARFQTALLTAGLLAWLLFVGRVRIMYVLALVVGLGLALAFGVMVDAWGYGVVTFPAWTYVKANILEGVALFYGTDPPFSYLWLLPANVFFPVVVTLLGLAILAWWRNPRHPVTWTTLPFFLVHNLLTHKEERFLFPLAILGTAFVTMALAPSVGKPSAVAAWGWARRRGRFARLLVAWSTIAMLLLAVFPLGWHHHVRFAHYVNDHLGGELRAFALADVDLGRPAFRPRVYELEKGDETALLAKIDERQWLVADTAVLADEAPLLAGCATLVYSELLGSTQPIRAQLTRWVDAYNANRFGPLRRLRYRSLYRLESELPSCKKTPPAHSQVFFADRKVKLLGGPE